METLFKKMFLLVLVCSSSYVESSASCNADSTAAANWQSGSRLSIAAFQTGNAHANQQPPTGSSELLGRKRLCPYTESYDYNPGRIPVTLKQIHCNCTECKKMNDGSEERLDPATFSCHQVKYPVPVLYERNCTNGMVEYQAANVSVTVACVCKSGSSRSRSTCYSELRKGFENWDVTQLENVNEIWKSWKPIVILAAERRIGRRNIRNDLSLTDTTTEPTVGIDLNLLQDIELSKDIVSLALAQAKNKKAPGQDVVEFVYPLMLFWLFLRAGLCKPSKGIAYTSFELHSIGERSSVRLPAHVNFTT
ncbi:uncharacterized protein LOC117100201 [Anneissia japonica]|uniref:uncharacterized protein LOC117100201 n=1 Tax=Anneissia japonica TaxID=1529436 RepID=UPI001425B0B9|nr:uncharacterized protein LOC117100201 [Anneissia japonica]